MPLVLEILLQLPELRVAIGVMGTVAFVDAMISCAD